jgi:hypothetical protein
MVRTTAQTFLGLTLGCARCHNHKFDPLTMVDYYSLVAILAPLKRPNQGRTDRDLPLGTPAQVAALKERDVQLAELDRQIEKIAAAQSAAAERQVATLRERQNELRRATPDLPGVYRSYEDGPLAPPTYLLLSGRASNPGPLMQPRVPAVLAAATIPRGVVGDGQPAFPSPGPRSSLRRLTFARWVASADNPLTGRVIVNRVWQHHFGTGLVATPSDFGHLGSPPSHPELLDWLAHWFMHEGGWSLKKLHRLILTSETYRQSSGFRREGAGHDAENVLLWRYPYRRLDAEAIRDSMLSAAGNLNRAMYGPAVHLPIAAAVIEAHTDKEAAWAASPEPDIDRRTIYACVKRTLFVPLLETLDFCDTTQSTERRVVTTVAPQALTLFNGEFVSRQADRFAQRLEREAGPDLAAQIELAFQLALARSPSADEVLLLRQFAERERAVTDARRALIQVCRVILNLNEFVFPN